MIESGGAKFVVQDDTLVRVINSLNEYSTAMMPLLSFSPPAFTESGPSGFITSKQLDELKKLKVDVAKLQIKIKLTKLISNLQTESDNEQLLILTFKRVRKSCHQGSDHSIKCLEAENLELGIFDLQKSIQLLKLQRLGLVVNHQPHQADQRDSNYFIHSKHLELDGVDIYVPHELEEVLSALHLLITGLMTKPTEISKKEQTEVITPAKTSYSGLLQTPIPEVSLRYEQSASPVLPKCFEQTAEQNSDEGDSYTQPADWRVFSAHKTKDSLFREKVTILIKNLRLTLGDNPVEVRTGLTIDQTTAL